MSECLPCDLADRMQPVKFAQIPEVNKTVVHRIHHLQPKTDAFSSTRTKQRGVRHTHSFRIILLQWATMTLKDGAILPFSGPSQQRENGVSHRLLGVPELLIAIFGPLKKGELARLARVCRVWSSIALDLLWRVIPDLSTLLSTGFLLRYDEDLEVSDFAESPADGSWDVVTGYAQRVRIVEWYEGEFAPAVIAFLRSRLESGCGSPYLLPNLRGIRFLVQSGGGMSLLPFIRMMPPGLQALDVDCSISAEPETSTQILKTILETPFHCLTSISISDHYRTGTPDVQTLAFVLRPQSNLEKLQLDGFQVPTESLATFGCHARLTNLEIQHRGESLQTVVELFGIIGSLFPKLRLLRVRLDDNLKDEVGISALTGISSCSEIRHLVVSCPCSENLTSRMVSDMGRWWPSMETYEVGSIPDSGAVRGAGTPLSILSDIVRVWGTTLRALWIALSPGDQLLPVSESPQLKFQHLQIILVALAPLSDDRLVNMAQYLAAITNQPFTVWGNRWFNSGRWAKVDRLIREMHQHESKAEKSHPLQW